MAQKAKRTSAAGMDPLTMLLNDHEAVNMLFRQFEKMHEAEEDSSKVIQAARQALVLHSALEQQVFYPAIREAAGEDEEELLDEAEVEHGSLDQLLAALRSRKLTAKKREAIFTVIVEYVRHHVKEEETEMFPRVRKLRGVSFPKLAEKMATRRLALEKKMRMPPFASSTTSRRSRAGATRRR